MIFTDREAHAKRNKALPEEYRVRLLLCALTYAERDSFDALPFVILRI